MKHLFWIALVIFSLSAMPLFAQRPGAGDARGFGFGRISGRVVALNADKTTIKVALFMHVTNPDAPGKVPDDIAQIAARLSGRYDDLTERAASLKKQGKNGEAKKFEDMANEIKKRLDEFKCWREVEATTSTRTSLTGILESPVNTIRPKTLVTFFSYAEGPVAKGTDPDTLVLIGPVRDAGEQEHSYIAKSHPGPWSEGNAANRTYFRVAGIVTSVDPLSLNVNGTTIKVLNPKSYRYTHRKKIAVSDVKPGLRIVQADLGGKNDNVKDIRALLINMNPNTFDREE